MRTSYWHNLQLLLTKHRAPRTPGKRMLQHKNREIGGFFPLLAEKKKEKKLQLKFSRMLLTQVHNQHEEIQFRDGEFAWDKNSCRHHLIIGSVKIANIASNYRTGVINFPNVTGRWCNYREEGRKLLLLIQVASFLLSVDCIKHCFNFSLKVSLYINSSVEALNPAGKICISPYASLKSWITCFESLCSRIFGSLISTLYYFSKQFWRIKRGQPGINFYVGNPADILQDIMLFSYISLNYNFSSFTWY